MIIEENEQSCPEMGTYIVALWGHCCRFSTRILKRYNNFTIQIRSLMALQDFTLRFVILFWNDPLLPVNRPVMAGCLTGRHIIYPHKLPPWIIWPLSIEPISPTMTHWQFGTVGFAYCSHLSCKKNVNNTCYHTFTKVTFEIWRDEFEVPPNVLSIDFEFPNEKLVPLVYFKLDPYASRRNQQSIKKNLMMVKVDTFPLQKYYHHYYFIKITTVQSMLSLNRLLSTDMKHLLLRGYQGNDKTLQSISKCIALLAHSRTKWKATFLETIVLTLILLTQPVDSHKNVIL